VREAQRRSAKVVIDPIRTRTAEAADWHMQIRPASDAALAMMHAGLSRVPRARQKCGSRPAEWSTAIYALPASTLTSQWIGR
jgi:formylmethanofuran dehydrogenase subunit B